MDPFVEKLKSIKLKIRQTTLDHWKTYEFVESVLNGLKADSQYISTPPEVKTMVEEILQSCIIMRKAHDEAIIHLS